MYIYKRNVYKNLCIEPFTQTHILDKHLSLLETFSWITLKKVVSKVFTKNSLTCFKQTPNLVHLPFEIIQYLFDHSFSVFICIYISFSMCTIALGG